jgi:FxsC-like protein
MALPDVVSAVQYTHKDFGAYYAKEGLQFISRQRKLKDDYEAFLVRFADKLISATNAHPLPSLQTLPSLKQIEPAFPIAPLHSNRISGQDNMSVKRPARWLVRYVYVVGTRKELAPLKARVEYYGNTDLDWRPFLPIDTKPVRLYTQIVSTEKELIVERLELSDKLIQNIEMAKSKNEIVIIIVDAWAFSKGLPKYRSQISAYDNFISINSALLILWNDKDPDTIKCRKQLESEIAGMFETKLRYKNSILFRDNVNTPDQLKDQLSETLEELMMNIINTGEAKRQLPATEIGNLPGIRNVN